MHCQYSQTLAGIFLKCYTIILALDRTIIAHYEWVTIYLSDNKF